MVLSKDQMKEIYNEPAKKMGIFTKIKKVLTSPTEFFSAVKSEQGYKSPIIYCILIVSIQTIITIGLASAIAFMAIGFIDSSVISGSLMTIGSTAIGIGLVIGIVFGILMYIAASFIGAGIIHLFVLLFNGKGGFLATYKASVYSMTPSMLFSWLAVLLVFVNFWLSYASLAFSIWSLYLNVKGISILHNLTMKKALLVVLIPVIIILLAISLLGMAALFLSMFL